MTKVVFLMSMGNWSVSHPRSGEPVFESTEPSMPNLSTGTQRMIQNGELVVSKWGRGNILQQCSLEDRYEVKCLVEVKDVSRGGHDYIMFV